MPKNILVDLNVILDVLLERPGYEASQAVLELQNTRSHSLFMSAHIVTTFAYLLEHAGVPKTEVRRQLRWMLQTFSVVSTSDDILKEAVDSRIADYEDAVVEQAALVCKASVIVTRNTKNFKQSVVPVVTPESLVARSPL